MRQSSTMGGNLRRAVAAVGAAAAVTEACFATIAATASAGPSRRSAGAAYGGSLIEQPRPHLGAASMMATLSPSGRTLASALPAAGMKAMVRHLHLPAHAAGGSTTRDGAARLLPRTSGLPRSVALRLLRVGASLLAAAAAIGTAAQAHARSGARSMLPVDGWLLPPAPGSMGASLGMAAALQCTSVALAASAATRGTHYTRRNMLLKLHALVAGLSLAVMAAAVARATVAAALEKGPTTTVIIVAVAFTCWATFNGCIALADMRFYPGYLKSFLAFAYGNVAKGKATVMRFHRTVGAAAYALTVAAAVMLVGRAGAHAAPAAAVAAVSLVFSAAVCLWPSASRGRFPLPAVSISRSGGLKVHL